MTGAEELLELAKHRIAEDRKRRCMICRLGDDVTTFIRKVFEYNDGPTTNKYQRVGLDRVIAILQEKYDYAGSRQPLVDHARRCEGRRSWGSK